MINFREKRLWLKSEWDFTPDKWACIGFKTTKIRDSFFKRTGAGSIIAFWIAQGHSKDRDMWGNLVGFFELSEEMDETQKFVCPEFWEEHELKWGISNRWPHGVGIRRAWLVNKDDWENVGTIIPNTYKPIWGRWIARDGKEIQEANFDKITELRIDPAKVYGQPLPDAEPEIETVEDLLRVREIQLYQQDGKPKKPKPMTRDDIARASRAGPISKDGYFVKDPDGQRYLYILKLEGSPENWLGENPFFDIGDRIIVKIGFSHDPQKRKRQIQSSYPLGQFEWQVMFPTEFGNPPAPNGETALIGEAAMKQFFYEHPNAESLGGEFYLVPENLCKPCFDTGLEAIA